MPLTLKVVFIGDTKVGKTSVLRRLLGEAFDPTFIMTTARETLKYKHFTVKKNQVVLEIWDAPGFENFRTEVAYYMKNTKAVIAFFDLTNRRSYENISNWLNFIPKQQSASQEIPSYIIGNKRDKVQQRCISTEEAKHKALQKHSLYYETSAREDSVDHFSQIFQNIVEDVVGKNSGLIVSGSNSMENFQGTPQERWHKKCIIL
ncbi:ras-related protein Rab-10-like [Xenia sp. Carnegie-2017]|uniref:ras-related protein Rab-10-like n=1 Tax=Xenia sp. Carnegie-2017 TaxID=2897299 RepID=UPI001F047316|nr:ras-related protein Rab-10-like [Xenia sp. Carnegie-2017]